MLAAGCSLMLYGSVNAMCSNGRAGSLVGHGSSAAKAAIGAVGDSTTSNGAAGGDRGVAHRRHLAVAAEHALARSAPAPPRAQSTMNGSTLGAALRAQRRDVEPRAHAPERVHAVEHRARHERRDRLDDRRRRPRSARAAASTAARDLGLDRQAPAGVQQQADAQAARRRARAAASRSPAPAGSSCRASSGRASTRHQQRRVVDACASSARRRGRRTAGRSGSGRGSASGVKMPHQPAGRRTEPPMSVPTCSGP